MCHISHQVTHLLFKYYISKLGWGEVNPVLILPTQGEGLGVQDLGKPSDVILELSPISKFGHFNKH